jgi:hypothetical protein
MRITREALMIKVVVRRARRGATPFVWEINRDFMVKPLYVSPETFVSMDEAYRAGQARLPEFTRQARPMPDSVLWDAEDEASDVPDMMVQNDDKQELVSL